MISLICEFYYQNYILITILTLIFALGLDLIIGDYKSKYHPVNIIGLSINLLKTRLRLKKSKLNKLIGIILLVSLIFLFCIPILLFQAIIYKSMTFLLLGEIQDLLLIIIISLVMGFILKWSFALKSLGVATKPIKIALLNNDIEKAKYHLSFIVRRNCKDLNSSLIISATVECIAESITDGITSVLWFYFIGTNLGLIIFTYFHQSFLWLLFGITFAYLYRIINTADSIVGYKDQEHRDIGWFSARMDDIANYVPTRVIIMFILLAGVILKKDKKNALKIIRNDKYNTESINAGWTMSTMAGLLNVQLEKIDNYKLGIPIRSLQPYDITIAYKIFKLTVFIFTLFLLFLFIIIWIIIFL